MKKDRYDMNTIELPEELRRLIEHDSIDFVTKANRNFPISKALGLQNIDSEVFTNLLAPMKLSHLLLPILTQNKNSVIMNVTSGLAYLPMPSVPIYSAIKAA
jgi:short-subunit dehydrogenase involved in D-alanine esterification of teichoic acids